MNNPALKPLPTTSTVRVTDEQVRHYVDQGFLVVPGLVSPTEIETLKHDLVTIARGGYPCEAIKPADPATSDTEVLRSLLCVHQPHFISPVCRQFVAHAGISAVLARVCAAHLPHWDGSVKCMQSMFFAKPPGKPGQAWHQDEEYIPTRDRSLAGAWIAIDDATVENGCLWVVPGSHRNGYLFPMRRPEDLDEYDGSFQSHGFDESAAVPVPVAAGSVVFFNGYLLHKSLKNRSTGYRRVLVNHYCNAWSLLPWQIEGEIARHRTEKTGIDLCVATADHRAIVPVAGVDPYAWKGYVEPKKDVWLRSFDGKAGNKAAHG